MDSPRRALTLLAWQVATELNAIDDDAERELLREHFEATVQLELSSGAQNRRMMAEGLLLATAGLVDREGKLR